MQSQGHSLSCLAHAKALFDDLWFRVVVVVVVVVVLVVLVVPLLLLLLWWWCCGGGAGGRPLSSSVVPVVVLVLVHLLRVAVLAAFRSEIPRATQVLEPGLR